MEIVWSLALLAVLVGVFVGLRKLFPRRGRGETSAAEQEMGKFHYMMGDRDRERIDTMRAFNPDESERRRGA